VVTPIYSLIHLTTSPVAKLIPSTHASSVLFISSRDIAILPFSITLSFLLPSVLMMYTGPFYSLGSPIHQRLIASWQLFPIYTVTIHHSLRWLYTAISPSHNTSNAATAHKRVPSQPTATHSPAARYLQYSGVVYSSVIAFCTFTHIAALALAIFPPELLPDRHVDPALVSLLDSTTFASVFIPSLPLPGHQVEDFAAGVHAFLQWDVYISTTALLLWALVLYRNTAPQQELAQPLPTHRKRSIIPGSVTWQGWQRRSWQKVIVKVGAWSIVAGPYGAIVVLLWERDEIVKQKVKQGI
jgi:hypothetical protein